MTKDEKWMTEAIRQAEIAFQKGEVPVGAVIVQNDKIIAAAYNQREQQKNALCHAELSAIRDACQKCGGWRLEDCELYVTLEPCPMCAGAAINARLKRVIYGTSDSKNGSCGSVTDLMSLPYTHRPQLTSGVLEKDCRMLLTDFFKKMRQQKAACIKKGIIFDLDGTLWNSSRQVLSVWNSVLKEYGLQVSEKQIKRFYENQTNSILPDLPSETAQTLIKRCYKAANTYLLAHGGTLYPDTEQTLNILKNRYSLYIIGYCDEYLSAFLDYHDLRKYFDGFETHSRTGRTKAEMIRALMKRHHLTKAVYVADTDADRASADTAGIPFVYAAYGFGKVRSYSSKINSPSEIIAAADNLL